MAKRSQARITGFRATDVVHHRNGVCGRSFTTVRFSFEDEGTLRPNMMAVFPVDAQTQPGLGDGTECYVIDLNDPSNCMRGDNFLDDVQEAIKVHEAASHARFTAALKR
jgi:hypothetical protein